jgi:hypothetical protein
LFVLGVLGKETKMAISKNDVLIIVPKFPRNCNACPMASHNYNWVECVPLGLIISGWQKELPEDFDSWEERWHECPLKTIDVVVGEPNLQNINIMYFGLAREE